MLFYQYGESIMQKDIQNKLKKLHNKLRKAKKDNFLVVVDFAGTLFALGPDKEHIKDPFIPDDAEVVKGARELDPNGCQNKRLKPFQKGKEYGWTVIPSVARLLRDIQGVNIIASSVANDSEQVSLQKTACRDNHIRINHVMTKDAEGIIGMGYQPSTIVILGDTSSDIALAEKIAKLSPQIKVICGFTPSGMESSETVQKTLAEEHLCIELISEDNWSNVIRNLRKRLPIRSQHLYQFKKYRKQKTQLQRRNFYALPPREKSF